MQKDLWTSEKREARTKTRGMKAIGSIPPTSDPITCGPSEKDRRTQSGETGWTTIGCKVVGVAAHFNIAVHCLVKFWPQNRVDASDKNHAGVLDAFKAVRIDFVWLLTKIVTTRSECLCFRLAVLVINGKDRRT